MEDGHGKICRAADTDKGSHTKKKVRNGKGNVRNQRLKEKRSVFFFKEDIERHLLGSKKDQWRF